MPRKWLGHRRAREYRFAWVCRTAAGAWPTCSSPTTSALSASLRSDRGGVPGKDRRGRPRHLAACHHPIGRW